MEEELFLLMLLPRRYQWRTQGGFRPPTFQKVDPRDPHKNLITLVGWGGVGQICQEVVSEILEKHAKNGFSRVDSKVLVSKKCLNEAF